MLNRKRVLVLTLHTFSLTGGIEKVCRTLIKALFNAVEDKHIKSFKTLSMYDGLPDVEYLNNNQFVGFEGNKLAFGIASMQAVLKHDIIILSHIHLLIFGQIIKKINPQKRIIVLAHGIEVWKPMQDWKSKLLKQLEIWAVSTYTAKQLMLVNGLNDTNIRVVNNGLDPFFSFIEREQQQNKLKIHYQIQNNQPVLLTIARLSSLEQYKGYDLVLLALKDIVKVYPNLIYFIVGKADEEEKSRINGLIIEYQLTKNVYLTGFVTDDELTNYYQLADIFVMPSKGEGFGLVFIEAAAHGCAVIAGNKDGSTDALRNGELGNLVDPDDAESLYNAILNLLQQPKTTTQTQIQQQQTMDYFGFKAYEKNIVENLLN